jgi:rhodanese-related sulfurtransferase
VERWFEFMGNHPFLFGTLAVLVVLFFVLEGQRNGRKISPQSLGILVKAKNAMLIDLRDAKDFREGHISGSRNIPYSQITKHAEELKAADRPLVFICNLGQVAGTALQQVAHTNSYRLDGGISNWKAQGLPLVKAKYKVESRSSAKPAANFAMVLQLAGATKSKSAQRASSICPMPASASGLRSSVWTGLPDKA